MGDGVGFLVGEGVGFLDVLGKREIYELESVEIIANLCITSIKVLTWLEMVWVSS